MTRRIKKEKIKYLSKTIDDSDAQDIRNKHKEYDAVSTRGK